MTRARERLCVITVAGIIGRLTAAGLGARHLDRAAGLFEQLDRSEADAGPEQIDQTRHQQRDARRTGHFPRAFP